MNNMKKETVEEAAKKHANKIWDYSNSNEKTLHTNCKKSFLKGANWQAKRMYSEEDMIKFAEFVASYPDKNRNVDSKLLHAKSKYDGAETTIDLFKQFKKETV